MVECCGIPAAELQCVQLQCGFNKRTVCSGAVFVLTGIIKYYVLNGSYMQVI